jgi:glycosyltransferase involved in cell wall biosynthesis
MTAPLTVALMLESDGPGGAEVLLLRLAEELRRRGHTVHPIGPAEGEGWLGERFRELGFEPQTYRPRRSPDLRCVRHLAGLMRRLGVDLLNGHEFDGAIYGTAAARLSGRPSVVTMHGNHSMTQAWRRRTALRWAFRASQAVVAVSDQTKQQLDRDLGLRADAVRVIHNGMPVGTGDPAPVRRELGLREDETLILAVGNLVARKGHIVLLQALQRLEREGLGVAWRLAIAGGKGGPERAALEIFIAEHQLADRVHILTYRDDVPNLQAAAEVFVMPSLWEGFPLAILEAMLSGTPVIASDVCGIPEAIVSGEHGLLTPPGDVEALATALRRLLTDPSLREQLAAGARARALREFTLEAMATAYERLYYTSLLPQGRARQEPHA